MHLVTAGGAQTSPLTLLYLWLGSGGGMCVKRGRKEERISVMGAVTGLAIIVSPLPPAHFCP